MQGADKVRHRRRSTPGRTAGAILAVLLAGCTYHAGEESPVSLSLSWFSYIGANDLREGCGPGAPERYRMVYNGVYTEQIRTYDVAPDDRSGAIMSIRVRGIPDLTSGIALGDLFAPWRGQTATARLDAAALADLRARLEQSGLYRPGPDGLRLESGGFYWVAAACSDGKFALNAWKAPSERFSALTFPPFLLAHDPTGVPINAPRDLDRFPPETYSERQTQNPFEFILEPNRLVGASGLFGN
jgi:hypothetical protein